MKRLLTIAIFACAAVFPAVADARYRELGEVEPTIQASCPADPCQAITRVTAYMNRLGDRRRPFRVPHSGYITAWTIKLGRPNAEQFTYFTNLFGGPSQARLAVVRPGKRKKKLGVPHRLIAQSETQDLEDYFGSSPTFVLDEPIRVRPGNYIALTVPTWAPALGLGLPRDNSWLSSRKPSLCTRTEQRAATQAVGGLRHYGCAYRTSRLLYSATYVPDPRPTKGS